MLCDLPRGTQLAFGRAFYHRQSNLRASALNHSDELPLEHIVEALLCMGHSPADLLHHTLR